MKYIFGAALVIISLGFSLNEDPDVVRLPITFIDGYGQFPAGFAMMNWKNAEPTDDFYGTELSLKGIPTDWSEVVKRQMWLDAKQFAYQNYKEGKITQKTFDNVKSSWKIDLNARPYSDKAIKCFVYMIYGKKGGKVVCKIDTDNDLDFTDETEFAPTNLEGQKNLDSLALKTAVKVKYEAIRNGKVVELSAPMMILTTSTGTLLRNTAQHAEATFNGTRIKISSGFNTMDYDPASIYKDGADKLDRSQIVEQNEFIEIDGVTYQNLGVNIDQQVLMLKRMAKGADIFSTQVGFKAKPFAAKEFKTGEDISLDSYKGKFLYLEFWGSWCGPCVKEIPNLKKAYENLDHSKIEFLGVALDDRESLNKILDKEQIEWKQILCEKQEGTILAEYNIKGYPTSFLIDPNGKILAKNLRGDQLLESINVYLTKN